MDSPWIILLVALIVYKIYDAISDSRHYRKNTEERLGRERLLAQAEIDYPNLGGKWYEPTREFLSSRTRNAVWLRTSGKCFYCDCDLTLVSEWQVDHIWPHRFGGSDELINLAPSCKNCNEEKWCYLPTRFLLHKWVVGKNMTKHELRLIEYFRKNSMEKLISKSSHWKGVADYWYSGVFQEFADLVVNNKSIKFTYGSEKKRLLKRTQEIYRKLDPDVSIYGASYRYDEIERWLN